MKNILIIAIAVAFAASSAFAQDARLSAKDLKNLNGKWRGTLTYVDYGSGKRTSIPSNLIVKKRSERKWNFSYEYPDEPKANSADDVVLTEDGVAFDNETIDTREILKDGTLKFVTWKLGTDNEKRATFRYTYLLSKRAFSIKKEVLVEGSDKYFERNTYAWSR